MMHKRNTDFKHLCDIEGVSNQLIVIFRTQEMSWILTIRIQLSGKQYCLMIDCFATFPRNMKDLFGIFM